jgi:hypothetical protein
MYSRMRGTVGTRDRQGFGIDQSLLDAVQAKFSGEEAIRKLTFGQPGGTPRKSE